MLSTGGPKTAVIPTVIHRLLSQFKGNTSQMTVTDIKVGHGRPSTQILDCKSLN